MASARDVVFIVGIAVLLPLCSIQHFIWPLSWCLLADICNHTWIPECGYDELMDSYRLFIDECDMFEYNCDHETDYEVTNYSLCFSSMHLLCPKPKPCPSRPACPDHRYHRMGDRYVVLNPRRQGRRMLNPSGTTLSMKMMNGKRRYTPEKLKRIKRNRTHYILRTRRTTPLRTRPRGPPTKHTWSKKTIETLPTMTESIDINQRTTNEALKIMFKILTLFVACLPLYTKQHWNGTLDWCLLSKICNHTGILICGRESDESPVKTFLDQCDLYENNCDYNKKYREIDMSNCPQNEVTQPSTEEQTTTTPHTNTPLKTESPTTTTVATTIPTAASAPTTPAVRNECNCSCHTATSQPADTGKNRRQNVENEDKLEITAEATNQYPSKSAVQTRSQRGDVNIGNISEHGLNLENKTSKMTTSQHDKLAQILKTSFRGLKR
ncbi:hypothetical protein O0L34_g3004 [Tuta absoluta]|nr:hypothetical protein O0L34_g3004 [Tuta absoluta]